MHVLNRGPRADLFRSTGRSSRLRYMAVLAAAVFVLSSCSHTKILGTWKDPEHQGYPKKVLVYDMAWSPDVKVISENLFVEHFEKHGVAAVASHKFVGDDLVVDKEAMKKIVQEQAIDAVFVGGPKSVKELQSLRPGSVSYETGMYADPDDNFYAAVSGVVYTPGTYAEDEIAWELDLYDVKTKKRIWSVMSETYVTYSRVEEIRPAVDLIMRRMIADKVIP